MIVDQQVEWTGSAEYADVVLPANSWVEFQDVELGASCSNPFLQVWGGDGIDFSGSSIEVDGTLLRDVRDKAISVGEGSTLTARNLVIEKCGTGAVSKDGSKTAIRDSRMSGITHVAMMAYIKKPEYGAAQLEATNVTIEGAPVGVLAQTGCRVLVDGVEIAAEELDVDALYKKGYMKK